MTEDKKAREAIRLLARRVNALGDFTAKRKARQMDITNGIAGLNNWTLDPFLVDTGDEEVDLMVNAT